MNQDTLQLVGWAVCLFIYAIMLSVFVIPMFLIEPVEPTIVFVSETIESPKVWQVYEPSEVLEDNKTVVFRFAYNKTEATQ